MEFADPLHPEGKTNTHMQHHIQHLAINNPCHQSWAGVSPTDNGRHCASCRKEVIDFSEMSTEQVLAFFSDGGQPCGRFSKEQLERINRELQPQPLFFKWTRAASVAMLLAGLVNTVKAGPAQKKVKTEQTQRKQAGDVTATDTVTNFITVSGIVTDKQNQPLPGATVQCGNLGTQTNPNGSYVLRVPEQAAELIIKYIGFKSQVVNIHTDKKAEYNVVMEEYEMILGEPAVVRRSFLKRQVNKIRRLLRHR